jgi:alkylation response protein AidB-like acyl-CoA dehydrogenase
VVAAGLANGGAERVLEMTVEYAKEREQFGVPIGNFQGVAHPIANIATEIEGSKTLTYEAAWAAGRAGDHRAGPLAAMAKQYAADVFKRATRVGHQVFGGIGFTNAIDMQLYFRRAKQLELSWFEPRTLAERVAAAELDGDQPFVTVEQPAQPDLADRIDAGV